MRRPRPLSGPRAADAAAAAVDAARVAALPPRGGAERKGAAEPNSGVHSHLYPVPPHPTPLHAPSRTHFFQARLSLLRVFIRNAVPAPEPLTLLQPPAHDGARATVTQVLVSFTLHYAMPHYTIRFYRSLQSPAHDGARDRLAGPR